MGQKLNHGFYLTLCLFNVGAAVLPSFNFDSFNQADLGGNLTTANTPSISGTSLQLCASSPNNKGQVWFTEPIGARGFTTTFVYEITDATNKTGDGFAFVIQNANLEAEGSFNGGLGYGETNDNIGIANSLAVEWDTYLNSFLGDPNNNHISVHTNPGGPNSANESYSIYRLENLPFFVSPGTKQVTLTYEPTGHDTGNFTIVLDKISSQFTFPVVLEQKIQMSNQGLAYIGFTASTGQTNSGQNHLIHSWSYQFLGVPDSGNTFANGVQDFAAGESLSVTIVAVDQYGNQMNFGGASFVAILLSDTSMNIPITDNGDGTYSLTFTTTKAAVTKLQIGLGDLSYNILESPFPITISPGAADPAHTIASELTGMTGLNGGSAGSAQQFIVQLFDQYENLITDPDPSVSVQTTTTPAGVDISCVFSNTTNAFVCSYNQTVAGTYALTITLNGSPIQNGTSTITISPGSYDTATSPPIGAVGYGMAGYIGEFKLQLHDAFNNDVVDPPDDIEVLATITPGEVIANTTYLGEGLYSMAFLLDKTGDYQVSVTINNVNVANSPFELTILPGNYTWAPSTVAFNAATSTYIAGEEGTFQVQLRDLYNNNITQQDNSIQWGVTFMATGSQTPTPAKYSYVWNETTGYYQFKYNVTLTNTYEMSVTINNTQISGSPYQVSVSPNVPFAAASFAKGTGLSAATTSIETNFVIYAKDQFNNTIPSGVPFVVELNGKTNKQYVKANVVDNKDGTYSVSYTLKKKGEYSLSVKLNNANIMNSPFTVNCKWIGLSTVDIVLIGVACAVFVALILVGVWVYNTKFKKRREYTALRTVETDKI
eukprot:TRINITY_DN1070_c0_g1_i1.p1 TRINITY_DN1070_c0_g1~~TRINITY_DN1070_c0_g1_i1.p1  ORF type:complete len:828 (-),score=228.18 TRINITY_DN1070_c0_g1_i1:37-2520(-)